MDSLTTSLDASLARWNLLNHPFYLAWSAGTLPVAKLQSYATEYGHFIATIAESWRGAGEPEIAAEEESHLGLWKDFSSSIGAKELPAAIGETKTLVSLSNKLASEHATALGSLYAFEAQQPRTTASKQDGLEKFYRPLAADDTYFRVHREDEAEPALLLSKMRALSGEDQARAADACEQVSRALWDALTGIDAVTVE